MKQKATMTQIARQAGVSIATVSRILNGTGQVKPATRQKVLQAIQELEYSSALNSLIPAYQTILVRVSDVVNPFYAPTFDGIQPTDHGKASE